MLDAFGGAGGAGMGYYRAGFDVIGIDKDFHPDYPFPMVIGDAMHYLTDAKWMSMFDAAHASPPCPRYSLATPAENREDHPDLVPPVREALVAWGGPWVIENVPGAPLRHPLVLCGSSFGLRVRRHRLFESDVFLMGPSCNHRAQGTPVGVYGQHADKKQHFRPGTTLSRAVKATSVADAQDAMGIDWMNDWSDLADAIPPAYTEHIGAQLIEQAMAVAA